MESVVWAMRYVEKNVECAFTADVANIPDLESVLSVAGRERAARFGKPQGVSTIVRKTFCVHILRRIVHVVTSRC